MNASRITPTLALIAAVGFLIAAAPPLASRQTWPAPNAVLKSGTLSFTGHSTLGEFVGSTTAVSGGVTGNAELANARGWVEAPVTTLSTGNGLRDRDLR